MQHIFACTRQQQQHLPGDNTAFYNGRLGRWKTLISCRWDRGRTHQYIKSPGRPAPARMKVSQSAAREPKVPPLGHRHRSAGNIRQKEKLQLHAEVPKSTYSGLYPGRQSIAAGDIRSLSPQSCRPFQQQGSSAPESWRHGKRSSKSTTLQAKRAASQSQCLVTT